MHNLEDANKELLQALQFNQTEIERLSSSGMRLQERYKSLYSLFKESEAKNLQLQEEMATLKDSKEANSRDDLSAANAKIGALESTVEGSLLQQQNTIIGVTIVKQTLTTFRYEGSPPES